MTQILILEQRPARIAAFRNVLEPDYNLTFVDSVKKAKQAAKEGNFVLFVSALHLEAPQDTNDSVFDFLRAVKENPKTKFVPFYFCCIRPSHFTETMADALETTARMLGAEYFELIREGGATRMYQHIKNAIDTGKRLRELN